MVEISRAEERSTQRGYVKKKIFGEKSVWQTENKLGGGEYNWCES